MTHLKMSALKIVLIGDSGVGKTSIFQRLDSDTFQEEHLMTVGGAFAKINLNTEKGPVECGVWDTAGQERFRNVVPMYFQRANFVICVFDVTSPDSYTNISMWVKLAREKAPVESKVILVGNKTDLESSRKISYEEGSSKAQELSISIYVETSAKTGSGIDLLLSDITKEVNLMNSNLSNTINSNEKITISNEPIRNNNKFCLCK